MLKTGGFRKRQAGSRGTQNQDYVNTLNTNTIYTDNISFTNDNGSIVINVGPIGTTSNFNQGSQAIAVGSNAGLSNQGCNSVAIGFRAGECNQNNFSVAIGTRSGLSGQSSFNIAIGQNTQASNNTGSYSIAIGNSAAQSNQKERSIAIGVNAGQYNQASKCVCIGSGTGQFNSKGFASTFIGLNAGQFETAGGTNGYSVAIGLNAGFNSMRGNNIAIGPQAGFQDFRDGYIAIGYAAGRTNFFNLTNGVAIGDRAGFFLQGGETVAIGHQAGHSYQKNGSVAIGTFAGYVDQGLYCTAIGPYAGYYSQGSQAVAIGPGSGFTLQASSSIAIGGTPPAPSYASNRTYMGPLRVLASPPTGILQWNSADYELLYNTAKTFVIDHPIEKEKYLVHACLEGPEAGVYYRGKGKIYKDNSVVEVLLPDYVKKIGKKFTIFVSPIKNKKVNKIISSDVVNGSKFYVAAKKACDFFYIVYCCREEIQTEVLKNAKKVVGHGPYVYLQ